jgi:PDZ domain
MVSMIRSRGRLPLVAIATGLGVWAVSVSSIMAQEPACTCPVHCSKNAKAKKNQATSSGFQGFGLGYHLGYGYGGKELGCGHGPYALGVGAEGGYPFYGGPGYPHPAPVLSRKLAIVSFSHLAGPGYPTPDHPNFFGGPAGQLVADQPVVTFASDPSLPVQEGGYGQFDGSLPYPESAFAPAATMIGPYGMSNATSSGDAPTRVPLNPSLLAIESLGMLFEPFTESGRTPGLKVTGIIAAGVVEKAGLHVGDVIVSINGYVTQKLTDPDWILLNASPDKVLKMYVRSAGDVKEHEVTAQFP